LIQPSPGLHPTGQGGDLSSDGFSVGHQVEPASIVLLLQQGQGPMAFSQVGIELRSVVLLPGQGRELLCLDPGDERRRRA
jgi:hypothetical protein